MKPIYKRLLITSVVALSVGVAAIVPVVTSANSYVAGFEFFALFLLVCLTAFVLFLAGVGLMLIKKKAGPPLLLAAVLVPIGFFGAAAVSKQLELGAYREDPMTPLMTETSNIVLFRKGVTEEQISGFWNETIATERDDKRGYEHLPGIQGVGRLFPKDGHEVVEFSFHGSATGEQRQHVYQRVRSSPIVYELRENVSTKDYMPPDAPASVNSLSQPQKGGSYNRAPK